MIIDDIGNRMKGEYESISKTALKRKNPVIIRIDGKAFHTFTKNFDKPFDDIMIETMQETMKYLCENIQGCVLGYTQSDEISLLLIDYKRPESEAWYNYEVQKVCSVSASMTTLIFNKIFREKVEELSDLYHEAWNINDDVWNYLKEMEKAVQIGAMFDSRCFNIPEDDVTNYFYWRQLDAKRNSIMSLARIYFSQKDLNGKNSGEVKDMLLNQKDVDWNSFDNSKKIGSCCIRMELTSTSKTKWLIDEDIPVFLNEGRNYIEDRIVIEEQ